MKKIILLILILVVTVIVTVSKDSKSGRTQLPDGAYISNQIKKTKWEYVKDRLFSGKGETSNVQKLNDPCTVHLRKCNKRRLLIYRKEALE